MSAFKEFSNKNIHVVGLSSTEGIAIINFLLEHNIFSITAHDFCEKSDFENNLKFFNKHSPELLIENMQRHIKNIHFKDSYLSGIEEADVIFVPQAWYKYECNKKLFELKEKKIPFETMTGLYLRLSPCTTIGVTGSNGKTTTSRLIYEILKHSGKKAHLVGNDRANEQILKKIDQLSKQDYLVLEISNRQLKELSGDYPDIAVITNIHQNHLDEHFSFEEYAQTKLKIVGAKTAIVFADKKTVKPFMYLKEEFTSKFKFVTPKDLPETFKSSALPGNHNSQNINLAVEIAKYLNLPSVAIQKAIQSFKGAACRLELVKTIDGIDFIDDTKSTTPIATKCAIEAFNKPITLILGGNEKNVDYKDLVFVIKKRVKNLIVLPGSIKLKLPDLLGFPENIQGLNIFQPRELNEALILAKKITKQGGVILISPAAENFYKNFIYGKSPIITLLNEL